MPPREHILITGNVGTGKTSAVIELSRLIPRGVCFVEKKGIFVRNYYVDQKAYAFLNQLDYSIQILERIPIIRNCDSIVLEDRSIYDTHCVFTKMQLETGAISTEQYKILDRICMIGTALIRPTLLVLLDCSEDISIRRIKLRNDLEKNYVTKSYLTSLRIRYRKWFEKFNICKKFIINVDKKNIQETANSIKRGL